MYNYKLTKTLMDLEGFGKIGGYYIKFKNSVYPGLNVGIKSFKILKSC